MGPLSSESVALVATCRSQPANVIDPCLPVSVAVRCASWLPVTVHDIVKPPTSLMPPLADQVPSAEVALLVKPKKFMVNVAGAAGTAPRRIEDAAIRASLDRFFMVLARG